MFICIFLGDHNSLLECSPIVIVEMVDLNERLQMVVIKTGSNQRIKEACLLFEVGDDIFSRFGGLYQIFKAEQIKDEKTKIYFLGI